MAVGLELAGRAGEKKASGHRRWKIDINTAPQTSRRSGRTHRRSCGAADGLTDQGCLRDQRRYVGISRIPAIHWTFLRKVGGLDFGGGYDAGALFGLRVAYPRGRRRLHLHCSRLMRLHRLCPYAVICSCPCILRGGIPVGGSSWTWPCLLLDMRLGEGNGCPSPSRF